MRTGSHENRTIFLQIWCGQLISMIGTGLTLFSLGIITYQKTAAASGYVFLLICVFLPPFLLKPLGGILADRYDRRMMMVAGDLGSSLGLVFIFFMMANGCSDLRYLYAGVALSSVFSAFQEPAYQALVTDLLPEEGYARAGGLIQLAHSARYLISPFLAGILITVMKIEYIFLIDITTLIFASSIVIWAGKKTCFPVRNRAGRNMLSDFMEGLRSFSGVRGVVVLVWTITLVLFFVGLLQSLLTPMLLDLVPARTVGISQSVSASGIILGSLFIGFFGGRYKHLYILSVSLFLSGIFFSCLGLSTHIIIITLSGFLFFASLPFINTSIEVLIRKNISREKQGRVWSLISMVSYLGSVAAFAVAGFLADRIFNPLLEPGGLLADTAGLIVGTGRGRGIALLFILSGLAISAISCCVRLNSSIRGLEEVIPSLMEVPQKTHFRIV
ncbi:MAG TPA: MFS transporter [Spirochaetota bacterium]|nr:MFS transporter [Spirochaetota bacterium]